MNPQVESADVRGWSLARAARFATAMSWETHGGKRQRIVRARDGMTEFVGRERTASVLGEVGGNIKWKPRL